MKHFHNFLSALTGMSLAATASGQCLPEWLPGDAVPGVGARVSCSTAWDPDGAGPAPEVLVCGGSFLSAGSVAARLVAAFDPATAQWSALGGGMDYSVYALTTMPNGDLVAAGNFTMAGDQMVNHIARWDGATWSPIGSPATNPGPSVFALQPLSNGDLLAGGTALSVGGGVYIGRWNGALWLPLGSGVDGAVLALAELPNGDIVAGGQFQMAGGVPANRVARWDGSTWTPMGSGMNSTVHDLVVLPSGDLFAVGSFDMAGGIAANRVARWDGSAWLPLSTGLDGRALSACLSSSGLLVVGGEFSNAGAVAAQKVAAWNGTAWAPLAGGASGVPGDSNSTSAQVTTVTNLGSDVVMGGVFTRAGGQRAANIARWNGSGWSSLTPGLGLDDGVYDIATMPDGSVVAVGLFAEAGGQQVNHVVQWHGDVGDANSWTALGSGFDDYAYAVHVLPGGDVIAGGSFTTADGQPANGVARWNGQSWSAMGGGPGFTPRAISHLPNGDIVVGGGLYEYSFLARWDGSSWLPIANAPNEYVDEIEILPGGDLVLTGGFTTAGGLTVNRIARWDGVNWSTFGSGFDDDVTAVAVFPNGDIAVGGAFSSSGGTRMARWNGATWSAMPNGPSGIPEAMLALPNGDVLAVGRFDTLGVPAGHIRRWNGATWSGVGGGLTWSYLPPSSLAWLHGNVVVGGHFEAAGGQASVALAQLASTCPAVATTVATACLGPAGPVSLAADRRPWIGSTVDSTAQGLAQNSLGLGVMGYTSLQLPLASVLPGALPNCDLLTSAELVLPSVPVAGSVTMSLPIPNDPVLIAATIHQQFVQLEFAAGGVQSVSSSNGLTLTLGTL